MKQYLSLILFVVSTSLVSHAQQPTHSMNGKTYFVYPYQQEIEKVGRQFKMGLKKEEVIHRDSLNRSIVSTEVVDIKYPAKMNKSKDFKRFKKTYIALRKEYSGVLLNSYLPLEQDIVPTLEPLPDGEYVQFYRDIPYVDENNILRYRNDIVAAVFTLKNNQLNGAAYWLTTLGDTAKAGNFLNGQKEGPWFHHEYYFNTYDANDPKAPVVIEKYIDGTYKDTSFILVNYKNGLLDGTYSKGSGDFIQETGSYKNGDAVGEWHSYGKKMIRQGIRTIYTDETILLLHYFIPEKKVKSKSVIVRNQVLDQYQISRLEYNIDAGNYFEPFCNYYKLYELKEEEGLELPEEKTNSYPGADYEEGMIYGDYGPTSIGNLDFSYGRYDRKYSINQKDYTRNELIDSVGYEFQFDKVYEEYHQNGQLKMRFEIKDGQLVKEDTIFWDNGNPVNIITYLPETNEYEERTFDYDNKMIYTRLYDSIGNFKKNLNEPVSKTKHLIKGKVYQAAEYDQSFRFENQDTLNHILVNPETISESLWRFDTTTAIINRFDPTTRTYEVKSYAINKDLVYQIDMQFGEEYENVAGSETYQVGKLSARTLMNGEYVKPINRYRIMEEGDADSVLNRRVKYWGSSYNLTTDYTLFYDDKPFSGKFNMTSHTGDFALKTSSEAISFNYSTSEKHNKKVIKALKAYKKNRKISPLTPYMTLATLYNFEVSENFCYNALPFLGYVFNPVEEDYFYESREEYDYDGGKSKKLSEKKAEAFDKQVEGQFLNGKPSGEWITRDQFGNVTAKVTFVNGEMDGTAYFYATEYPEKIREGMEYYYASLNPLLKDSLPAKPTHYLAKISNFKNGILNGPLYEMNWMGDTITKWNYRDGYLNGPTIERTKLAYTTSNYEDGATDGITQTYLTIPGRDTTLLFDLNFQNGALQGESKSYHLNGNLAKHGFFLAGQPIDDFQAYDTLGFQYQYVKFQYNQPIEEKIWEENQLSVRYEFDWKDSIYFNTSDITGSTSLDRMLYQLGLNGDGYGEPYFGRPSLVDKTGIKYTMTKYYPNDTVARKGEISSGKKIGQWDFYNYDGEQLYEVNYFDTILQINDTVRFKSKGIMTLVDKNGQALSRSYIVEKVEKYDCSHTDHHEIRMLYTFWERDTSVHRINGYVKNYFDNGVLMNEGMVKNGLATGVWKFYDPYGSLNMVGEYVLGKRQGRWLSGDLSQVKYMGDICLNPNLTNLEEILSYQEKLLDISVVYYQMTVVKKREYYGVNMNAEGPPENFYGEGGYYDGEGYGDIEYYEGN